MRAADPTIAWALPAVGACIALACAEVLRGRRRRRIDPWARVTDPA